MRYQTTKEQIIENRIELLAEAVEAAWETIFGGPFEDYASNEPEGAVEDLELLRRALFRRAGLEAS